VDAKEISKQIVGNSKIHESLINNK